MMKKVSAENTVEGPQKKRKILVVEDNKDFLGLIRDVLDQAGFPSEGVPDGAGAIDWVANNPDSVLLLDYSLPDMTGKKVIETLIERNHIVPFLVITGRGNEQVAVEMMKLGSREYLVKEESIFDRLPQAVKTVFTQLDNEEKLAEAEERLRQSEKNMKILLDNSPDVIMQIDTSMKIVWANKTALDMNPEAVGRTCYKAFTGRDDTCDGCPCERAMETGKIESGVICKTTAEGGQSESCWEDIVVPLKDDHGEVTGVIEIARNITDRVRAERMMIREKERAQQYLDVARVMMVVIGKDEKISLINKKGCEILGFENHKEIIGKNWFDTFLPERSRNDSRKVFKSLMAGQAGFIEYHEDSVIAGNGREKSIAWHNALIKDADGTIEGMLSSGEDVTERRKMEEEIRKIDKLESIGILAGGIAHDFNNILTGIMGNIGLARMQAQDSEKVAERLEEAEKASVRAKDLTQQLLTFAKGGRPVKKVIHLGKLLEESVGFSLRGSNVRCVFSLPEDLWQVEADEGQMNQAISNIVINADEAMPEGGVLHIRARNVVVEEKGVLPLRWGEYVEITVEDQGAGIHKEHLGRIFEPYFTTKQKGSGLGMSVAYSVFRNHGGHITVESELGNGTIFRIYLPALKAEAPSEKEISNEVPVSGGGRILVMDDEEMVRDTLGHMLHFIGYEVVQAKDGHEAVKKYVEAMESDRPFEAVILDLTIPGGMGGKEVAEKILKINPETRIIASSGYATDPVMSEYAKYGFSSIITKPYTVDELRKVMGKLLELQD